MGADGPAIAHPHVHAGGTIDRRRFLGGLTAAAAAGAAGTLVRPARADTAADVAADTAVAANGAFFGSAPAPEPIPAIIPTAEPGFDPPPPFDLIHWLLPGPDGATTPILGLPGFGLDVDPSTITDFRGFTAYAVISGSATGHDGTPFDCEFDLRVMRGTYRVGGEDYHGTFGFF